MLSSNYSPRTVDDPTGRYSGGKQVGPDPSSYEFVEFALKMGATRQEIASAANSP